MLARADWEKAFLETLAITWESLALDASFEDRVRDLVANKYGTQKYNQRR